MPDPHPMSPAARVLLAVLAGAALLSVPQSILVTRIQRHESAYHSGTIRLTLNRISHSIKRQEEIYRRIHARLNQIDGPIQ
jgi:hypothetical protein